MSNVSCVGGCFLTGLCSRSSLQSLSPFAHFKNLAAWFAGKSGASCIVISINYRHAPENPYPAAINDAAEALVWITSGEGKLELGDLDMARVAVGGLSAGGNLAAILSMKAATMNPPLLIIF